MAQTLTGYPSIDKPWLKYYSEKALNTEIPKKTMYELLYDSNKNRLDNVAIKYYGNSVSYRELFRNIKTVANAFSAYGITKGDVVTILSLNTPETTYAIYALNYIGAVANLLVANNSKTEIEANLRETNSKMFLVLNKMLDGIGNIGCSIPIIMLNISDSAKGLDKAIFKFAGSGKHNRLEYKAFIKRQSICENVTTDFCDAPAIIVYTSGTTGNPKGVVLSNRNLNSCAVQCLVSGKEYQPNESFLNILPPFFSFGIGMKHLCFYAGMTEIPALIPKVEFVIKMIKKHKPNRFVIGPAFTDTIEKYPQKDLSFLVDLTGGGGSVSLQTERLLNSILEEKGARTKYLSGYGMTELSAAVSMNHNNNYREQSIGLPLPITNVKVCNPENGEELCYGEEGELLVNSPSLMLEYYNNVDETSAAIRIEPDGTRWMRTGDLAKIDEDGFVYITGRLKRIYIVTDEENVAYKLFPQRMEEIIQQIPEVNKCAVIVLKDTQRGFVPVVFVSTEATSYNIKELVMESVKVNLPKYYCPKAIIVLDKIPVNSNQKVDYRALEREVQNVQ